MSRSEVSMLVTLLSFVTALAVGSADASIATVKVPDRIVTPAADGTMLEVVHGEYVRPILRVMERTTAANPYAERVVCDLDGDGANEPVWARKLREEWDQDGDGHVDQVFVFDEMGALRAHDADGDGWPDAAWRLPGRPV
jgi:hypothetical protein